MSPGRSVGLEHLSLYAEPVPAFVAAAAAGGADTVCLSVNHPGVIDSQLRPEVLAQLDVSNVSVAMGDGFLLRHGGALGDLERQLDLIVEFGGRMANTCAFEPDENVRRDPRLIQDLLGEFCRSARAADVDVLIEFTPLSHVPTLAAAVELIEQIDEPNLKILVDTLHLARAGEGPADIAKVDPALFAYCQLSDGPGLSRGLTAYMDEAVFDRALPGTGEFPLEQVLAALPPDIVISAEVPLRTLEQSGVSPEERARRALEASRQVLNRAF
jgi:sugar phosphate isomerase/epimerase